MIKNNTEKISYDDFTELTDREFEEKIKRLCLQNYGGKKSGASSFLGSNTGELKRKIVINFNPNPIDGCDWIYKLYEESLLARLKK